MFLQISICYSAETCAEIGKEAEMFNYIHEIRNRFGDIFSELCNVDNVGKKGFTQRIG